MPAKSTRARHRSLLTAPGLIWAAWVTARALLIVRLVTDTTPAGDVAYYLRGIYGDDPQAMTEYPQPGTWPTLLVGWLTGNDFPHFILAFSTMMLLVDASFLALLLHLRVPPGAAARRSAAAWFWVAFGTAIGHVFWWRLDLFPALCVAAAAAVLSRHPRLSAGLLALATSMKLWPGVLAAGLVGRLSQRGTWARVASFAGTLLAICAGVAALAGVDRLLSPLSYQGERGLQIESVAASWLVFQAHRAPEAWQISYTSSKSFEISGPGVQAMLQLSTTAMALSLCFAVGVALYRVLRGGWAPRSTTLFFLAVILLLIASNKVLSPQYLVWVGPLIAVLVSTGSGGPNWHEVFLAAGSIIAAALGSYVYPTGYHDLVHTDADNLLPAAALLLRNALVLLLTVVALAWFLHEARPDNHSAGASAKS